MVRIKHRYLLFNILYPTSHNPSTTSSATSSSPSTTTTTVPTKSTPSFITLHAPTPSHITSAILLSTLRHSITQLFGDHGLGATQSGLRIVYFSPTTSTCILRCPRAHVRLVWASLTFMDTLPGAARGDTHERSHTPLLRCVVQVVRVSGTVRKSEEELLRRARRDLVRAKKSEARVTAGGDEEEGVVVEMGVLRGMRGPGSKGVRPANAVVSSSNVAEGGIEDLDYDEDDLDDDLSDMDE